MTPWLVDASALLAADADDDNHRAAVELPEANHPLLALDLAYYEVSNVAIRAWHDQEAAVVSVSSGTGSAPSRTSSSTQAGLM